MDSHDQPIVSSQLTLDIQQHSSYTLQHINTVDPKDVSAVPASMGIPSSNVTDVKSECMYQVMNGFGSPFIADEIMNYKHESIEGVDSSNPWDSNMLLDHCSKEFSQASANTQADMAICPDALSISEASVCSSMDHTPDITPSADLYYDHSAYFTRPMAASTQLNSSFALDQSMNRQTYFSDHHTSQLTAPGGWIDHSANVPADDSQFMTVYHPTAANVSSNAGQVMPGNHFYRKQVPRRHNTVSFSYNTGDAQMINESRHARRQSMSRLEGGALVSPVRDRFDSLTKAQLIERVVQLEQEKKIKQGIRPDSTTMASSLDEIHKCQWATCALQTSDFDVLIDHIRNDHVGSGKPAYFCEWEDCPRNRKPFLKRHKMYNHMRTHTGERPFVCSEKDCDKKFSRPDSLNTHIKTHSNVKPFACPIEGCGKAYFHSRSLRKHSKSHGTGANHDLPLQHESVLLNRPEAEDTSILPEVTAAQLPFPHQHDSFTNMTYLPFTPGLAESPHFP